MPSLTSRRAWAVARRLNPSAVHVWFHRKRYAEGRRRGRRPFGGSYDLPLEQCQDGRLATYTLVKQEDIVALPSGNLIQRIPVQIKPNRHTRAHKKKPDPKCIVCCQQYVDNTAVGAHDVVQEVPVDDIHIKRERAKSPPLSVVPPSKRRKTQRERPLPMTVKVGQDASHMLHPPQPGSSRTLISPKNSLPTTQVSAYSHHLHTLCVDVLAKTHDKIKVAVPVRHTRAHESSPNEECAICSYKFLTSVSSPLLSPGSTRQPSRISPSPTPELSSAMPSSDFDFDPRFSTPATSDDDLDRDTIPKIHASRISSEEPENLPPWSGSTKTDSEEPLAGGTRQTRTHATAAQFPRDAYTQFSSATALNSIAGSLNPPSGPSSGHSPSHLNASPPPAVLPSLQERCIPPRYRRKDLLRNKTLAAATETAVVSSPDSSVYLPERRTETENAALTGMTLYRFDAAGSSLEVLRTGLDLLAEISASVQSGCADYAAIDPVIPAQPPTDLPPRKPPSAAPSRPSTPERPGRPITPPAEPSPNQQCSLSSCLKGTEIFVKAEAVDATFPPSSTFFFLLTACD